MSLIVVELQGKTKNIPKSIGIIHYSVWFTQEHNEVQLFLKLIRHCSKVAAQLVILVCIVVSLAENTLDFV